MIHPAQNISISRQCELLDMGRSSYYHQPMGESSENLHYMRIIDEQYLRTPYYGYRKMAAWMIRQGHEVNKKRIKRLMRIMHLQGAVPGPHTSKLK